MAFHVIKGTGRGGRGGRRPIADINVTPLVDVMLVLLIIFMVTAPLLVAGVPVDLPDARARALPDDQTPVQIAMTADGRIFIDRSPFTLAEVGPKLAAIAATRRDSPRVYVRADSGLDYGNVMKLVGEINAAGLTRVALVTEHRGERKPVTAGAAQTGNASKGT